MLKVRMAVEFYTYTLIVPAVKFRPDRVKVKLPIWNRKLFFFYDEQNWYDSLKTNNISTFGLINTIPE